ncbi:MAG: ferritin family protein [Campylobacterales bacterium]
MFREQVVRQQTSFLKFLYSSLILQEAPEVRRILESIADFKYRHTAWAMEDGKRKGEEFDASFNYRELEKLKELKTYNQVLEYLREDLEQNLKSYESEEPTILRFKNDDTYFLSQLKGLEAEGVVTAFNDHQTLPGVELSEENRKALVFFLLEETFKEYELITIYTFYKIYSTNATANSAFTDLAYDSIYHLKRFGELAAQMGILPLPRVVSVEKFRRENLLQFLKENIEEEKDAEKNCLILAEKIGNPQLKEFLLFISRQELYHGELLQRALESLQ